MMTQPVRSFKASWKQITVFVLAVVYVAINILRIGGDKFVFNLNTNISAPLALGVTLMALMLWRHVAVGNQNRLLWSGLTIGWIIWTVAESWWGVASIIGHEVPYPSWADLFWIVGYLPIYIALWTRIRSLPQNLTLLQRVGLWLSILFSMGGTIFFVLIPIVRNNDSTTILESALNILYPLMDIILLILVLRIFFTYQQGMYGRAWMWLSAGFVLLSLSDLIFAHANTTNLYYPDGQINSLSTFGVDIPYVLSYLFWLNGMFIVQTTQSSHQPFDETVTPLSLAPNAHLLVFTNRADAVIEVSNNYSRQFPLETVNGKTISEVLGLSLFDTGIILKEIKANKILKERAVLVNSRLGQQQALVSGTSIVDSQREFSGTTILVRMFSEDLTCDRFLTASQLGIVWFLLRKTGVEEKEEEEIKQLLSNYYGAFLKVFYNRILIEGGGILAESFLSELQSVAEQHNWHIGIHPYQLLDVSLLPLTKTQEALPVLFETAKQFVAKTIDQATANTIIQNVRSHFDETTLKNVAHFEKLKEEHP
jgi:hypothetical protein